MEKLALVTGAMGFAGQTLCRTLKASGWNIIALDKPSCSRGQGTSHRARQSDLPFTSDQFSSCDISDSAYVDKLFEDNKSLTHIFHLAAITFVPHSKRSPAETMEVNLNGTINIIEAMKRHTPAARLLFTSSSEIYGTPVSLPVTENHPFNPQNPYAISKLAADLYCGYEAGLGMDIIRMRPFNHSGSGQSPHFVLSDFCKQVIEIESGAREPIIYVGNLAAARDFSHVDDVVSAYELAALKGKRGAIYNVCSGESYSIANTLEQIIETAGVEVVIEIDKEKFRPVDVPEIRGSATLLSDDLHWKPEKSMTNIIDDLLAYWRKELI